MLFFILILIFQCMFCKLNMSILGLSRANVLLEDHLDNLTQTIVTKLWNFDSVE